MIVSMSSPQPVHVTPRCPIRTTLELIGGRWKLLLVQQLSAGPLRFGQLRRLLPDISEKMLAQELHQLTTSELVQRAEADGRITYVLTPLGQELLPLIAHIRQFGQQYMDGQA